LLFIFLNFNDEWQNWKENPMKYLVFRQVAACCAGSVFELLSYKVNLKYFQQHVRFIRKKRIFAKSYGIHYFMKIFTNE